MQFHFELIKFTSNTYLFTAYLPISVGIVQFGISWCIPVSVGIFAAVPQIYQLRPKALGSIQPSFFFYIQIFVRKLIQMGQQRILFLRIQFFPRKFSIAGLKNCQTYCWIQSKKIQHIRHNELVKNLLQPSESIEVSTNYFVQN